MRKSDLFSLPPNNYITLLTPVVNALPVKYYTIITVITIVIILFISLLISFLVQPSYMAVMEIHYHVMAVGLPMGNDLIVLQTLNHAGN